MKISIVAVAQFVLATIMPVAALAAGGGSASVVTVSPGENPVTALAAITDASATKPYLLKINPGLYNIGYGTMTGKAYVDIEGSGEGVTIIRSDGSVTLVLAEHEEVRSLTLKVVAETYGGPLLDARGAGTVRNVTIDANEINGGQPFGIATWANARFDHVTVSAQASVGSMAVFYRGGDPVFEHCSLSGGSNSGMGIYVGAASGVIVGTIKVTDSTLFGGHSAIQVGAPAPANVKVTRSTLNVPPGYFAITAMDPQAPVLVLDSIIDAMTGNFVKCVATVNSMLDPVTCPYP